MNKTLLILLGILVSVQTLLGVVSLRRNISATLGGAGIYPAPTWRTNASTTVFLVPHNGNIGIGQTGDLVVGTSSTRSFLRLFATSTVGIYVTLGDLPCNGATNASYFLSASTTATARAALEFDVQNLYTGAVHACGVGGTTSVSVLQGSY